MNYKANPEITLLHNLCTVPWKIIESYHGSKIAPPFFKENTLEINIEKLLSYCYANLSNSAKDVNINIFQF
jgi:hypothetical protein